MDNSQNLIFEKWWKTAKLTGSGARGSGTSEIYKNPSKQEVLDIIAVNKVSSYVRIWVDRGGMGDIIAFDSYYFTHTNILARYRLDKTMKGQLISLYYRPLPQGEITWSWDAMSLDNEDEDIFDGQKGTKRMVIMRDKFWIKNILANKNMKNMGVQNVAKRLY